MDKVLKVSAQLDEASFRTITDSVRRLNEELLRTAETFARLQQHMGGGGGGVSHGGITPPSGGAASQPFRSAAPVMQASAGIGGMLGRGMEGVGALFKGAADAASGASRSIVDAMRDTAAGGEQHLRRLTGVVAAFADALRGAQTAAASARGSLQGVSLNTGPTAMAGTIGPSPAADRLANLVNQMVAAGAITHDLGGSPGAPRRAPLNVGPFPDTGPLEPYEMTHRERQAVGIRPGLVERVRRRFMSADARERAEARDGLTSEELASIGFGGGGGGGGGRWWNTPLEQTPMGRSVVGHLPGGIGSAALRYGPWAAAAYGAYRLFDGVTGAMANISRPNIDEAVNHTNFYDFNRNAAAGGTFGNNAASILMGGDMARAIAIRRVQGNPALQRQLGAENALRREQLIADQAGMAVFDSQITGQKNVASAGGPTVGNISNQIKQKLGQEVNAFVKGAVDALDMSPGQLWDSFTGSWAATGKRVAGVAGGAPVSSMLSPAEDTSDKRNDIMLRRGRAQAGIDMMRERQRMIEAEMASDPLLGQIANQTYNGAFGQLGMLRAAGISGAPIRDKSGTIVGYSGDRFAAGLQARGFTEHEGAAAIHAMGLQAGRGNRFLGSSLLGPQAGGMFNAAQLVGAGARTGGDPMALFRAVQGVSGAGGLDVTAGAHLGGMVAGMMPGFDRGLDGTGLTAALGGVAYAPGQSAGESLRQVDQLQRGLPQLGNLFGGRTDGLGQALTRRAALRGAGNLGHVAADALERLLGDPGRLIEIKRKGNIPPALAGLGITMAHVDVALRESNLQNTVRTIQGGLPEGSPVKALVEKLNAAGGDLGAMMMERGADAGVNVKRMQELRGKKTLSGREQRELDKLQGAFSKAVRGDVEMMAGVFASDLGISDADATGMLSAQLALTEVPNVVRGKGAGDPTSRESLERVSAGGRAKATLEMASKKAANDQVIRDVVGNPDVVGGAEERARAAASGGDPTNLGQAQQQMTTAITQVAAALQGLARRINETPVGRVR